MFIVIDVHKVIFVHIFCLCIFDMSYTFQIYFHYERAFELTTLLEMYFLSLFDTPTTAIKKSKNKTNKKKNTNYPHSYKGVYFWMQNFFLMSFYHFHLEDFKKIDVK